MKVFEVMVISHYNECEYDVVTKIFEKEETATDFFKNRVECAREEAISLMNEESRVEYLSKNYYEVYKEGSPMDYTVTITLTEKEVN